MDFGINLRPTSGVLEIARAVIDLMRLLGALSRAFVIQSQTVGTSSTPIDHGLTRRPRWVFAMPHADARVWRPAAPDARAVYLQASASVTVDIFVVP